MQPIIPASAELIAVIEQNCESKSIDYKAPMVWDTKDKKKCCELVKDVLAFANTEGGHIVIGVAEEDHGFQLVGVTADQAGTFETSAICQFIQNYSDPPINLRIQKVAHKDINFVVLTIPRFGDTPHICQKDYPGVLNDRTLYVRTDNNESAPIKSSADFRGLIENAIRNRKDAMLSSFRAILTGSSLESKMVPRAEEQFQSQIEVARKRFDEKYPYRDKDYTFFVETVFYPEEFEQYRFNSNKLRTAAERASISFTGWPFLFIHYNRSDCLSLTDDGLEGAIEWQDFVKHDAFDFWKFNESGLFYKKELTALSGSNPPVASAQDIVRYFAEAIHCMTRLYENLFEDSEIVTLRSVFLGTRNRTLNWNDRAFPSGFFQSNYSANRPSLEAGTLLPLAEWKAGLSDHAIELASEIMKGFGFEHPNEGQMKIQIENLFSRRF